MRPLRWSGVFPPLLALFFLICEQARAADGAATIAKIPAGSFLPLFGAQPKPGANQEANLLPIDVFALDVSPVSESQFYSFVKAHPEWSKENALPLYVDGSYLKHWKKGRPETTRSTHPIVHVSWFAATAFCESRGGRLPSTLEWEYVAAANEKKPDARSEPEFNQAILRWYEKPTRGALPGKTGLKPKNFFGVSDLHGLVWEWTSDFNSSFISSDSRTEGSGASSNLVCGGGAEGASNREEYASFMRYALRGSLSPRSSLHTLGFRCAYDKK